MRPEDIVELLDGSTPRAQQAIYAAALYEFTLVGRAHYLDEVDRSRTVLRAVNEMNQVLAKQLLHLLRNGTPDYPSAAFVEVVMEQAAMADCVADIEYAFERVVESYERWLPSDS